MLASCRDPLCWVGCYKGNYDLVTAESYAHPAKMAVGLCYRIFEHLKELGLLGPGSVVLDPMAGTGMTGLVAGMLGYRAILVELEPEFIGFIQENKGALERKLGHPIEMEIIQGDARNLSGLLRERGLVAVSSPPYLEALSGGKSIGYGQPTLQGGPFRAYRPEFQGDTPGQIGKLADKPIIGLTSPPYADSDVDGARQMPEGYFDRVGKLGHTKTIQGDTEGQIARLPDRSLTAITSPPYEDSNDRFQITEKFLSQAQKRWPSHNLTNKCFKGEKYGQSEGQIGQEQGETYLSAMAQVYAEIAKVADVLVVVVKCPTRQGRIRRLDLDTISLLEATGWRINCVHQAMLFEETEQGHLFDGSQKRVKGRLSFFKRLAWQKGIIVADHEDIIVAVKK